MNLTIFNQSDFLTALRAFFAELQVPIASVTDAPIPARDILANNYKDREPFDLIDDVYFLGMVDDAAFRGGKSLEIAQIKSDYDGILIFGVTLRGRDGGLLPTRSQLAEISRAFNREFCYTPVVVVFKYGEYLAFANTERLKYKDNREGEKAGKVTLLRDIDIRQPHSGHAKILADLKIPTVGKDRVDSFDGLYKYWQKVLDVSLLNKKFYQEVSYWYLDAGKKVVFPKDAKSNQDSLIRLITRLMFVWFLKEKKLVPDALFHREDLRGILNSLEPQDSSYYKAILQNLFFATLNTEWGERRFRKRVNKSRDQAYMVHNEFRYAEAFVDAEGALAAYFKEIPFLNGGLFECLDRRDENESEIRIDGFSDRADNALSVPNELFFGELQDVDLNADFGTSRKKYQVRGLIEIFNSYKFTIAENTPLEEDVALDPELLGQVFENLLAAYNPETQTTARKQTGSFYTPREIVNYMVDESLIAYFKNELSESKEDELEQNLRQLLSFDDVNPFAGDDRIQERLIQALDSCKIIDPACGSGAFPMGILQKMVHILKKLDPRNERWKMQQKEKAIAPLLQDIQFAEKISYEEARDRAIKELRDRLKEIEASFENEIDYPRKLFLIQNCIYGVDIQAIAVQIAKLRCFISLIIDQREVRSAVNRGILPLPNLETKFVAANSLIGVEKVQQLSVFVTDEIAGKQRELEKLRREHFYVSTFKTKRAKRQRDRILRQEISQILKNNNYPSNVADLLSNWEPYDPNFVANFFDPEWMFGITDGFDIAIGNPPYIRIQELDKNLSINFKNSYNTAFKNYDIYVLFIERAVEDLIKESGCVCFINPTKFIKSDYGTKLKELIYKKSLLELFIDLTDVEVFDSAITYTGIFLLSKSKKNIFNYAKLEASQANHLKKLSELKLDKVSYDKISEKTWLLGSNELQTVFEKIKCFSVLSEFSDLFVGLQTSADPVYILEIQGDKLYSKYTDKLYQFNYDIVKPLLKGAEIKRYSTPELKYKIIFPYQVKNSSANLLSEKELTSKYPLIWEYFVECQEKLTGRENGKMDISGWWAFGRNQNLGCFVHPKIMTQVLANHSSLTLDLNGEYYFVGGGTAGGYGITLKENSQLSYQYLLGLLNSTLIEKYLQSYSTPFKGGFFAYNRETMGKLPIPTATEAEQKAIETLVQKCLDAKGQNVTQWEQEIDTIVARLYGLSDEEMKIIRG